MTAPAQRRAYGDDDDMTLVRLAQDGDREAFGALYNRRQAAVYQYLNVRCGNNPAVAQDLAADVWERALRGIRNVNYGSPMAWLMTIARNRAIDHFRSGRVRLEVLDTEAAYADHRDPAMAVEDTAIAADEATLLLGLVKQLPAPQLEAIALTYYAGLNSNEAAEVMDKTANAVKALTLRGRRSLARCIPEGTR